MDPVTLRKAKNYTDAQVFPADLTGQADGDYIRNDAGVWKPKTANEVMQDLMITDQWEVMLLGTETFTGTAVAGTGTIQMNQWRSLYLRTGATANSTVRASTNRLVGFSAGISYTIINWTKTVAMKFRFQSSSAAFQSANAIRWVYWGDREGDAVADPTRRGIGIRVDYNAVKGICHNGSALDVVDLGVTQDDATLMDIIIISNNGAVSWYVDGVLAGSSSSGPAALGLAQDNCIRAYVTNGADTTDNIHYLHDIRWYLEQ